MTLGQRLNELLNEKYLSAATLAKSIGLSGVAVRKWRRIDTALKLEHLLRVAEYFDCSLDYLCGRSEDDKGFNKNVSPVFAVKLKEIIENSKKPIDRISKETGLDRRNFYDWFNGMSPVSSTLIILADYFDCSVDYLIGLEE